jgi:hypothetical protein
MPPTGRSPRALVAAVVAAHAVVTLVHGAAHAALGVTLSAAANAFVVLVIVLGPLAGLGLLLAGRKSAGGVVLGLSMAGALVFGAWNHFVAAGPDHVAHLAAGPWRSTFQVTAALLAAIEAGGVALALGLLRSAEVPR